ncbi:putative adhesive plaque matrix protein, partial [Triplophysa rosa]
SAPVPLGHLPPDCGLTSPTRGGLVYATPYDGCGVAQQGGNYFMWMLW